MSVLVQHWGVGQIKFFLGVDMAKTLSRGMGERLNIQVIVFNIDWMKRSETQQEL